MVGSAAGVHPTAAVRAWGQLAPVRRTEVIQDDCQIWASVKDMLVAGNTKVTDLLCVTPPWIPEGAHAMTQLVELPPADVGLAPHRHSGPVFRLRTGGQNPLRTRGGRAPRNRCGSGVLGTWRRRRALPGCESRLAQLEPVSRGVHLRSW